MAGYVLNKYEAGMENGSDWDTSKLQIVVLGGKKFYRNKNNETIPYTPYIKTKNGRVYVSEGDYVIRNVKEERRVIKKRTIERFKDIQVIPLKMQIADLVDGLEELSNFMDKESATMEELIALEKQTERLIKVAMRNIKSAINNKDTEENI